MKTRASFPPRRHAAPALGLIAGLTLWAVVAPLHAQTEPEAGAGASREASPEAIKIRPGAPVTLNFVNAEIEAVARAIAAMLNRSIVVDPRVRGQITVTTERPQPPAEAYRTFLASLRGLGFTVVDNAGLLKVVPESDAKVQTGTVSVGPPSQRGDQVLTQIFQLRFENPNNLVGVLRPLITANNTINAAAGSNSLIITDYADNLQRIAKIIAALDVPSTTDFDVIPLKHAVAADIAPLVQRLSEGGGPVVVPGAAQGGTAAVSVIADSRSNALIVRAPNAGRLASVRGVIEKIDRPVDGGGPAGNIWVVYLKHADATKMAEVLRATISGGSGGSSSSSSGSSSSSVPIPASPSAGGGVAAISAAAAAPVGASPRPSTGGQIQADPATNALIITAPEPLYRQLRGVIDKLDSRRAQVYIESMIVEVSGDNAADFGFQWQGLLGKSGDTNLVGLGTNFGTGSNIIGINTGASSGNLSNVTLGEGFNIGLVRNFGGTYALAAIARVLQSQTNTNIVSTPNLMTLDNEEAKIIVGSNVPFVTGQFTNTGTATTSPFQTIERKDVGITLRIRPQIGEGGSVRMTIFQESSSLSEKVAPGTTNAGPSTDKRSIESTVSVDDGAILVLGGLIEDKFTEKKSKVPLLGDIPYVGALFRSESRTKTRTNLMVFLRPVVMRDSASQDRISLDRYDLIRSQQQAAQPVPSVLLPINESPTLPERPPAGIKAPVDEPISPAPPKPDPKAPPVPTDPPRN